MSPNQNATEHSGSFINGIWEGQGDELALLDPSTAEVHAVVHTSTVADVDRAVTAALAASRDWARTSPSERGAMLAAWAGLVFANQDRLAAIESRNVGKPLAAGLLNVQIAGSIISYAAGAADKLTGATLPVRHPDYFGYTAREPFGVCAIVLPWNVPAVLGAANLAPALAAGNSVVLKPSEVAPLVLHAMVDLAHQAGIPPGVLNVLTGVGAELGSSLVGHPGVNHVSFVGSVATGRAVMQTAAQNLTPVKLELGGKSPQLVFADADLDRAVPAIVRGITENAGQNCNAGSRLLVDAQIADEVTERVVAGMAAVRIGAWDEDLEMGPLVNAVQHERICGIIDGAVATGAELLLGGTRPEDREAGYFLSPTVLRPTEAGHPVVNQEIFGPVLTVESFASDAEALALANGTDFGLLASVWTQDVSRALSMARDVVAGQISVNQYSDAGVIGFPFNMAKQSGFSSAQGYRGLYEFTREKAVAVKL